LEERADVGGQKFKFLEGGKVAAGRRFAAALEYADANAAQRTWLPFADQRDKV
jgi:hypothetical protein